MLQVKISRFGMCLVWYVLGLVCACKGRACFSTGNSMAMSDLGSKQLLFLAPLYILTDYGALAIFPTKIIQFFILYTDKDFLLGKKTQQICEMLFHSFMY